MRISIPSLPISRPPTAPMRANRMTRAATQIPCCPMHPSAESWQMHPMWISLPHLSRIVIPELHCNFSTTCRKLCPTAAKHPGVFLFTAITLKRRQSTRFPFRPGTFRWEQVPFPRIPSWRNPAPTIPKSAAPAQTVIRSWNTH